MVGGWVGLPGRVGSHLPPPRRTTFSLPQTGLRRRRPRGPGARGGAGATTRPGGEGGGAAPRAAEGSRVRRLPEVRGEEAKKSRRGRGRASSRWTRPGPGRQNRNRNPCARLRSSRGPHRRRPPPPAARAPARAPEPGEPAPALRVVAAAAPPPPPPPASGAGVSRPGRTGTSRPSRERPPTGASGRSRRRPCGRRKSPGLAGMGSNPRH